MKLIYLSEIFCVTDDEKRIKSENDLKTMMARIIDELEKFRAKIVEITNKNEELRVMADELEAKSVVLNSLINNLKSKSARPETADKETRTDRAYVSSMPLGHRGDIKIQIRKKR